MADGIVMSVGGVVSRRAFKDAIKAMVVLQAAAASLGINIETQTTAEWQQELLDHILREITERGIRVLEQTDVDNYRVATRKRIQEEYEL